MSKKFELKPVAAAVGAALATSVLTMPTANADENPFGMTELSSGYMVAYGEEGKCGEGKCGEGEKAEEGKCGEGNVVKKKPKKVNAAKKKLKKANAAKANAAKSLSKHPLL